MNKFNFKKEKSTASRLNIHRTSGEVVAELNALLDVGEACGGAAWEEFLVHAHHDGWWDCRTIVERRVSDLQRACIQLVYALRKSICDDIYRVRFTKRFRSENSQQLVCVDGLAVGHDSRRLEHAV